MTATAYFAHRDGNRIAIAKRYGEWTVKLPGETIRMRHMGDLRGELGDRGYSVERVSQ